jgi:hypothetical protein
VRALLLFVPTFVFALVAVGASAWAMSDEGGGDGREATARNRIATLVAVVAAVLCALSLLAAAVLLVLHAWSAGSPD